MAGKKAARSKLHIYDAADGIRWVSRGRIVAEGGQGYDGNRGRLVEQAVGLIEGDYAGAPVVFTPPPDYEAPAEVTGNSGGPLDATGTVHHQPDDAD